jgi:hypothetical protein
MNKRIEIAEFENFKKNEKIFYRDWKTENKEMSELQSKVKNLGTRSNQSRNVGRVILGTHKRASSKPLLPKTRSLIRIKKKGQKSLTRTPNINPLKIKEKEKTQQFKIKPFKVEKQKADLRYIIELPNQSPYSDLGKSDDKITDSPEPTPIKKVPAAYPSLKKIDSFNESPIKLPIEVKKINKKTSEIPGHLEENADSLKKIISDFEPIERAPKVFKFSKDSIQECITNCKGEKYDQIPQSYQKKVEIKNKESQPILKDLNPSKEASITKPQFSTPPKEP